MLVLGIDIKQNPGDLFTKASTIISSLCQSEGEALISKAMFNTEALFSLSDAYSRSRIMLGGSTADLYYA